MSQLDLSTDVTPTPVVWLWHLLRFIKKLLKASGRFSLQQDHPAQITFCIPSQWDHVPDDTPLVSSQWESQLVGYLPKAWDIIKQPSAEKVTSNWMSLTNVHKKPTSFLIAGNLRIVSPIAGWPYREKRADDRRFADRLSCSTPVAAASRRRKNAFWTRRSMVTSRWSGRCWKNHPRST